MGGSHGDLLAVLNRAGLPRSVLGLGVTRGELWELGVLLDSIA